jgi:hypothetical protein
MAYYTTYKMASEAYDIYKRGREKVDKANKLYDDSTKFYNKNKNTIDDLVEQSKGILNGGSRSRSRSQSRSQSRNRVLHKKIKDKKSKARSRSRSHSHSRSNQTSFTSLKNKSVMKTKQRKRYSIAKKNFFVRLPKSQKTNF